MQGTPLHDQAELKQSAALNILLTELKGKKVGELPTHPIMSVLYIKFISD